MAACLTKGQLSFLAKNRGNDDDHEGDVRDDDVHGDVGDDHHGDVGDGYGLKREEQQVETTARVDGVDFFVKGFPKLFLHNQHARAPLRQKDLYWF